VSVDGNDSCERALAYTPAANVSHSLRPDLSKIVWRIIPEIDKNPKFVAYIQREEGRKALVFITILLAFSSFLDGVDLSVAPLAAVCGFLQKRRLYFLPLATFVLLCKYHFWIDADLIHVVAKQEGLENRINASLLFYGMPAFVIALCSGLLVSWPRISAIPLFRRPTLCLISIIAAVTIAAQLPIAAGMPRVVLWSFLMTILPYLWFLAYALADSAALPRVPFWQRLGAFHPFWGASLTPLGKGISYLSRFEAKTPEELAVTQLKGLKLACWTLLLAVCAMSFNRFVHGYLALQDFDHVFSSYAAGARYPRYLCWASLVASFLEGTLNMTVWGGAIIALARLAGFRLLRNTYKPLAATTLAEFWNRYYFYYKELLVDHFFYPVFLRFFRKHRNLRMFFATFMAACVGNILFHFIRELHFVAELGWKKAVLGEAPHAFYTFLLAIGVGISQMRPRKSEQSPSWLVRRVLPFIGVALFFCILHVFDAPQDRSHSIWQRVHFLSYLLGTDTWL
jgi:hypothetical protein